MRLPFVAIGTDMDETRLSRRALETLLAPERWRAIGLGAPRDLPEARAPAHRRWAARHTHAHANREILVVLSGRRVVSLGGRLYRTGPGVVIFYDRMAPHDFGYPSGGPKAEHLWIIFVEDRCLARLVEAGAGRKGHRERWSALWPLRELGLVAAEDLFPGEAGGVAGRAARVRATAGAAFLAAALLRKMLEPVPSEGPRDFQGEVIAAIQRHIRENAGRGCQLESLARIAGYSKYHFLRLFRRRSGRSLSRYVDECREEAYRRLADGGARQKAIAAALGFSHPSALTRWRKRRGLSVPGHGHPAPRTPS